MDAAATQRMLARSPLLVGLRKDVVSRLVTSATLRDFPRRTSLWRPGDEPVGLIVVRAGVLRESVGSEGRDVLLRLAGRGVVVGEVALLTGSPHHTELVAHDDASVVWIPRSALEPLDASLVRRLAASTAAQARRTEARLAEVAYHTVVERLAGAVTDLLEELGVRDSRGIIVNLRLTRRDLASLAGTTRESASAVVSQWQRAGLVETEPHRLVVLEPDQLRRLAGRPSTVPSDDEGPRR